MNTQRDKDDEVQHDKDVKNGLYGNDGSPGDPDVGLKDEPEEYISIEECRKSGKHLTSCDDDGYCNFCGEQEA